MLKSLPALQQVIRSASASASDECESALSWLVKAASSKTVSIEEHKVFQNERPWATAPIIIAHGKVAESEGKASGLVRWLHNPERDINIEFSNHNNMYSVQVRAVYYAIISAMFHRASHAIIYSTNEIVVKVGNGIYTPKKELNLFQKIRKRTSLSEEDRGTRVKLHVLDEDALETLGLTLENATSREDVPLCSEGDFRESHSSERTLPLFQALLRPIPRSLIWAECSLSSSTAATSTEPLHEVCTTGYSFKTASGLVSKYGVYWGQSNPHNLICEVPGVTHVAAMLMAMIEAARSAKKENLAGKIVIYTDYNCPSGFHHKLSVYASRDFHSYYGPKMKHAKLLRELYELTKDMDVTFKYRPAVVDKKPNYVMASILQDGTFVQKSSSSDGSVFSGIDIGDEVDADGNTPSTSSAGWPEVYTTAMYKAQKNGFTAASFAAVWSDKRFGVDIMERLAMVPATLVRAQLAAIEAALKEAVENFLPHVVVITDSQVFIHNWKNK
ncbi:unnamed protein product [Cylicocyclus nassatus]|uniref:Uncharacterized protein n=1 Tax=Cylicocyclus nassatus TaxID=53992 RepID=A0AA36H7D8_CYLNA|nr:unnamed protein product [Cylicocyclus nassatus]